MTRYGWIAAGMTIVAGAAQAAFPDRPKPEVYVRAEDRERARLASQPCTTADLGRGCAQSNGRLWRKLPCAELSGNVIQVRATDQCYKMQPPRRYRGVWIDAFEGQEFIPDGAKSIAFPVEEANRAVWKKKFERARAAAIWLDVSRVALPHDYGPAIRRMRIDFIGRKTKYSGAYGHMGLSGNEIIVDRVVSVRPIL